VFFWTVGMNLTSREKEQSKNTSDVMPCRHFQNYFFCNSKISPITGLRFPEGFRKLRFPDYVTTAQDGGKVVSPTHWPLFTPRKCSWYSSVRG